MYHQATYNQQRASRVSRIIAVVLVALLVVALYLAVAAAQAGAREQAAVSLRNSVLEAAKQCCAVEGAYPSTLAHLEDRYGLTVNHEDFVVSYEWFADNIMPTVVVTPK